MSGSPHPPKRIERAPEEAGLKIDPMEPAESQVDDTLDALRSVSPIRFTEVAVAIQFPAGYAGNGQAQTRSYNDPERGEWQNDDSWVGVITFPVRMRNDFYDRVNNIMNGTVETCIVKDEDEL